MLIITKCFISRWEVFSHERPDSDNFHRPGLDGASVWTDISTTIFVFVRSAGFVIIGFVNRVYRILKIILQNGGGFGFTQIP